VGRRRGLQQKGGGKVECAKVFVYHDKKGQGQDPGKRLGRDNVISRALLAGPEKRSAPEREERD